MDAIDIITHRDDYIALQHLLVEFNYTYQESSKMYLTEHFLSLKSNGIDVDIIIEFKVLHDNSIYEFPFQIEKDLVLNSTKIYLGSVNE